MKQLFINCIIIVIFSLSLIGCDGGGSESEAPWTFAESIDFGRIPLWSPEGTQILFGGDQPGQAGLYLWDLETAPRRIGDKEILHNWDYSWSWDGTKIAWSSPGTIDDENSGVYIYTVSDATIRKVYATGSGVSWFSDNERLALYVNDSELGLSGIYELAPDTGYYNAQLLFENGYEVRCSPVDGYYGIIDHEFNGRLHLFDSNGSEVFVTNMGVMNMKWSADGRTLAYARSNFGYKPDDGSPIWNAIFPLRFNSGGENGSWTSDSLAAYATNPAPNHDGTQFAYNRIEFSHWAGLYLYSENRGGERIAAYGLNPDYHPMDEIIAVNAISGGIKVLRK